MTRRFHWTRTLAAAGLGASLALALPDAAAAGPDRHGGPKARRHYDRHHHDYDRHHHDYDRHHHDHDRRHHRDDRHHEHRRSRPFFFAFGVPHPFVRPPRAHVHRADCGHAGYAASGYYCRPCGHRFASLGVLHDHVHHHHRIPLWKLPLVVLAQSAGLYVYG